MVSHIQSTELSLIRQSSASAKELSPQLDIPEHVIDALQSELIGEEEALTLSRVELDRLASQALYRVRVQRASDIQGIGKQEGIARLTHMMM